MIKTMFLGLVIFLGLLIGTNAWALDYTYTESGGEITITGYTGSGGDIVIPDTIEEMPVVTIRSYAFYICSSLFSITIPDSVTRIGDYAFGGCSSLMRITIPNSVTSIGYRAFANCLSLTRITIPNSVTYIESRAFERCTSLTSASFLGNAPSMESYVFDNCAPDFSIYYTSEAAGFTTPTWEGYPTANCPDDFFYTVSEGQATITDYQGCGDIVIPSEIDGMPVVSIGDVAFRENTSLTSVTIPDSVTSIGVSTFYGCSGLTSINIPNSVTSIGGSAFHNCSALTSVTIPNSVTSIGQRAFYNCSALTSVTIPNSVTIIREFLFYGCSGLTSITIPNKVIVIQDFAFYGCSGLTSVTIGNSVALITRDAFYGCTSLSSAYFLGDAPSLFGSNIFGNTAPDFSICYTAEAEGFTTPTWEGYPAADCSCLSDSECEECEICVEGFCILAPQPSFDIWTWMGGMEAPNWSEGNYGTKGVPDAVNVPMARWYSTSWTDSAGNLWLFGGMDEEYWRNMNDLWRYDTTTEMWTWMSGANTDSQTGVYGIKGILDANNVPGARAGTISWTDSTGNLWLFGGSSQQFNYFLNDLWRYDTATGMWAWMSGADTDGQAPVYGTQGTPSAANVPGARDGGISWTDSSGNLWLFGGYGYHQDNDVDYYGFLNDLWRYDTATGMWAWMSGADTFNQPGIYGIRGETDNANLPGCRRGSISWIDSAGNLWLFGGAGIDSLGNEGNLNDLWRYNPGTNQWVWMSGSKLTDQISAYGIRGTPDAANVPGARSDGISWTDSYGNLWLFGGDGYYIDNDEDYTAPANDLWRYDTGSGQWTWVSGSNVPNQVGIYAGKGTPCATSMPGARYASISWTDNSGNLWLFGGRGYWDEPSQAIVLNDLWRYELPECIMDNDCQEGESCVEGVCEQQIPDNPPALGDGPFLAAGTWPVLPTSQESPMYLDQNYDVLWTFSDDFASCSEDCTHTAEYQTVGGNSWSSLDVTANAAKGYAFATLPVESLQNATTYAFRFSVTDCASQTTQSAVYYFRVAVTDAPPAITSGPFLAAGYWPVLPTSASRAFVLDQNYDVLWTFSDDYAFCFGLCTHRARYRKVGDTAWTWITVSADPTGKKYAYTELPVVGLAAGTYQFHFDVRDCAGQRTYAPKVYYFKVE